MRVTPCKKCGTPIPATRYAYCTECRETPAVQHRNGSRTGNNAITRRPGQFIGVDGEGYTRPDGTHHYTMLSVGDATLTEPNGDHLDVIAIFKFLWEQFEKNPEATYIGFFLGYDFAQWSRTLPEKKAWKLWHSAGIESRRNTVHPHKPPHPVDFLGWEFDVLNRVRWRLRKQGDKRWMYVCDVGPYWQTSFLNVINAKWTDPVCTPLEAETLTKGKESRADVQTAAEWVAEYETTARYNVTENRILCTVMDRIKEGLVAEKVYLDRDQWFGPGQAAQEWLKVIGQPLGSDVRKGMPEAANLAAQHSYYGGWFEVFAHGHLSGTTWEFDLNSAYPAAMTHLPCPVHGVWQARRRGNLTHPYTLIRAKVVGSNPIVGAMLHRRADGSICRPHQTEGWYWAHELAAAKAAGLIDTIQHREAWELTPVHCECNPLPREIPRIYQRRLDAGKDSPQGKALKVIYNSAYGKLAQSIGAPKFGQAFAASYITSWCRTEIVKAIATHPDGTDALVMVATDGVYFRTPHPGLEIDDEKLGLWGMKTKTNLTILKPGVYYDDKARESLARGEAPQLKSRGISSKDLAANIARLDEAFRTPEFRTGHHWPEFHITLRFNLVGAKAAITRNNWPMCGQIQWEDDQPHVPVKRIENASPQAKRDPWAEPWIDHRGDLRTHPYDRPGQTVETAPYTQTFGLAATPRSEALTKAMNAAAAENELPDTPEGPTEFMGVFDGDDYYTDAMNKED